VGQRERTLVSPVGGVFRGRAVVMDGADVRRATWRIAHEILEHNRGADNLVLVGLQTGGVWIASALAEVVRAVSGTGVPVGALDVAYYRDDIGLRPVLPVAATKIPVDLGGAVVVLCDDVLFTGRTVRAALNALSDLGRPAAVQLAVMVDRGHRELPIRPDYVGKNLPTRRLEMVDVSPEGVVLGDMVAPGDLGTLRDLGALGDKVAPEGEAV
jgi:pyrimidine operon attenuation protein / uracil phosphoribosyltransferase